MSASRTILKILVLLAFGFAVRLSASPLVVGENPMPVVDLESHAEFLVDPTAALDIAEVSSPPWSGKFQPASSSPPSFGFTSAAVWMRCEIRSGSPSTEPLMVTLRSGRISHVSWFVVSDGRVVESLANGAADPQALRERHPSIRLEIPPGETLTLFARVASEASLMLPFSAGSPDAVQRFQSQRSAINLFLVGFCAAIAVFAALLGLMQRQSLYYYLAGFAAIYSCYYAIFHGYLAEFWPGRPFWMERAGFGLISGLGILCFLRFNGTYLDTRKMLPRERALQRSAEALQVIAILLFLALDFRRSMLIQNLIMVAAISLTTAVIILRFRHHRTREEMGFFITWIAFGASIALLSGKFIQALPVPIPLEILQRFLIPAILAAFFLVAAARQRSLQRLEIQLAETQALRSRAEKDRDAKSLFLANVSHEIRTPLSALVGLSQAMWLRCQSSEPDSEFTQFLNRVRSGGQYLGLLLRNVLNASAAESGRVPVRLHEFYLADWIDDVRNILGPLAEYHRGSLVWTLPADDESRFRTDEMRLTQILLNLAENALKFGSDSGKPVSIRLEKIPRGLRMTVEDHGPGIPADRLDSVFAEFVQAGGDASPAATGVGLGLSVVKINTTLLGGTLAVERLPDAGMRFMVEIPDAPAEGDAALSTPPAS